MPISGSCDFNRTDLRTDSPTECIVKVLVMRLGEIGESRAKPSLEATDTVSGFVDVRDAALRRALGDRRTHCLGH